ncbi:hypothetical protein C1N57_26990 (plasmid) [Priestia aryabhattai]
MKRNKKSKNQVDTYRPTVRYHSMYRIYVDSLFQATKLDRNQIMRCALFTAAHNPVFLALMNQYKMSDVSLPSSPWQPSSHPLWMEQEPTSKRKEEENMMTLNEKERLQTLLGYLEHQQMANHCQEQLFNPNSSLLPVKRQQALQDISNRLRDEQGRFLPYNYQTTEESNLIFR